MSSFKSLYAANYSQRDTLIMKSLAIFDQRDPSKTSCEKMLNMDNCWKRLRSRKKYAFNTVGLSHFLRVFIVKRAVSPLISIQKFI